MMTFNPTPCPCGCRKWIMGPTFACQCSSLSTREKDELMAMQLAAQRYARLRSVIGEQLDAYADALPEVE